MSLAAFAAPEERKIDCPAGFDLVGKRCIRERVESASVKCPRGINQLGVCVESRDPALKCEAGYEKKGRLCERKSQVDKVKKICEPGYTDSGVDCVRTSWLVKLVNYKGTDVLLRSMCLLSQRDIV